MQVFSLEIVKGKPAYPWGPWAPGVPQTNEGDLKMVTEWWRLGFVRRNPYAGEPVPTIVPPPPTPPYVSVEATPHAAGGGD